MTVWWWIGWNFQLFFPSLYFYCLLFEVFTCLLWQMGQINSAKLIPFNSLHKTIHSFSNARVDLILQDIISVIETASCTLNRNRLTLENEIESILNGIVKNPMSSRHIPNCCYEFMFDRFPKRLAEKCTHLKSKYTVVVDEEKSHNLVFPHFLYFI